MALWIVALVALLELGLLAKQSFGVPSEASLRHRAQEMVAQIPDGPAWQNMPRWQQTLTLSYADQAITPSRLLDSGRPLWRASDSIVGAQVWQITAEGPMACPWQTQQAVLGGGLGFGALAPTSRFVCGAHPAAWVGTTIEEDVTLRPRHCIHQQPLDSRPLRMQVSLPAPIAHKATTLTFGATLYYEDERQRTGAPVRIDLALSGRPHAQIHHRDGDGYRVWRWHLKSMPSTLDVTVTNMGAPRRSFCWNATLDEEVQP